jgi:hypothetical protein
MDDSRYTTALQQIARLAGDALAGQAPSPNGADAPAAFDPGAGCRIMSVPPRLLAAAAAHATRLNPVNAPLREFAAVGDAGPEDPLSLTLRTTKYWGPAPRSLTVSFLETTAADLRARIVGHMNAWAQYCGVSFTETASDSDVRISRGPGGYWSYLGTDIHLIPANRQTMNLQGFTMSTRDSEFFRVVRHETGHTLGFPHEHMRKALVDRIDPQKAYVYFQRTQGWDKQTVDQQVLTPLDPTEIIGTEADQDSIMCYQLPAEITTDGQPIHGGVDINDSDARFAGIVYPKSLGAPAGAPAAAVAAEVPVPRAAGVVDWDPREDRPLVPR